ncbi:hypothetical protein MKQ70_16740 [Chitinophaga sedimenti]|uniref:sigma factor n=1 Tax=Chitinophaga sedimenti TaxID=2033606 RepID=UPI0020051BB3|nr:sigma factor [Chitinophaga sedimenti]MCK7556574.1 hypothetical protein [Chitinophaga sedimenti]
MKQYQQELFPYAYNILGSAEDAKDAIQDVLGRYLSSDRAGIENEKAYLVKSVINQSINLKNKRKVLSTGEVWLPEPVATEQADSALHSKDIISYSMLVLLEQLNPKERAVFHPERSLFLRTRRDCRSTRLHGRTVAQIAQPG